MSFFSKYFFIIVWTLAIIIVGALLIWFVQANSAKPVAAPANTSGASTPSAEPTSPPPPPAPSVTLVVVTSTKGNTLLVQWANLPSNTTALDIYRSKIGANDYSLWKTLALSSDQLVGGSANVDLGTANESDYEFYFQAVAGSGGNTSSTSGGGVLWTSSSTTPGAPENPVPGNTPTPSPTPTPSSSTPTPEPPAPPPSNPSSSPPVSGTTSTPQGTPYYNPQVQISGYGSAQSGNFWVQHVNEKIEIGWQDLPDNTNSVEIFRSSDQDGPWAQVLTEENPGTTGSYSIQVVDDTLGQPYYYEMEALNDSTTLATYGPTYLAPATQ